MAESQLEPAKVDMMKEVETWVGTLAEKKDQVTAKREEFLAGLEYQTRTLGDLQRQAPRSLQKVHELKHRLDALGEEYDEELMKKEALLKIEETASAQTDEELLNEAALNELYSS